MKAVSAAIHDMGMLFGMYGTAGEMTCARYPGSLDWEENDAKSFAAWGVNYLKYDNCYSMDRHGSPKVSFDRFDTMRKALNTTGRPMVYSLCNWGEDYVYSWGVSIANSWRMSGDIYDSSTAEWRDELLKHVQSYQARIRPLLPLFNKILSLLAHLRFRYEDHA
ncbi:Alpha-galactosidase mel1 like protein [Verticillium longisporum]|nr:Alpha-galactosidase mel1 like protein [Verticillium longisporum]